MSEPKPVEHSAKAQKPKRPVYICCEKCVFWENYEEPPENWGWCHRFPPTNWGDDVGELSLAPATAPTDFCGEWRSAATKETFAEVLSKIGSGQKQVNVYGIDVWVPNKG